MSRTIVGHRLWICLVILFFMVAGAAIALATPCLAAEEDDVFSNIKTKAVYMRVVISFDVIVLDEGVFENPAEIEVLRANRKSEVYKLIGSIRYGEGKNPYEFRDDNIKKTSYYYKLRVKGKNITSKPFRGRASLLPPST